MGPITKTKSHALTGSMKGVRLSDALDALRADLIGSATSRSGDWEPLFEIEDVEIELTCVAKRENQSSGGVQFYVLTLGATDSEEGSVTQRVLIKLKPSKKTVKADRQNPMMRGK